jgi:hypothetical protein
MNNFCKVFYSHWAKLMPQMENYDIELIGACSIDNGI